MWNVFIDKKTGRKRYYIPFDSCMSKHCVFKEEKYYKLIGAKVAKVVDTGEEILKIYITDFPYIESIAKDEVVWSPLLDSPRSMKRVMLYRNAWAVVLKGTDENSNFYALRRLVPSYGKFYPSDLYEEDEDSGAYDEHMCWLLKGLLCGGERIRPSCIINLYGRKRCVLYYGSNHQFYGIFLPALIDARVRNLSDALGAIHESFVREGLDGALSTLAAWLI